jgi:hypothetical protein
MDETIRVLPVRYHTFVVRVWQDASDRSGWLVRVQHIQSGEVRYVHSLEGLLDFIERRTGGRDGTPQPRSGLR